MGCINYPNGLYIVMQTVVETQTFIRQAESLFSDDEKMTVIDYIAANPLIGSEIPGAGGVRKIRVATEGKGKRSGARVIYYWYSDDAPIYALAVYGKNKKIDLSAPEKKAVTAFAKAIKAEYRSKT